MENAESKPQDLKQDNSIGSLASYELLKPLGETHLYPVYLAQKNDSAKPVVIKTMDVGDESFYNECRILSLPTHPRIVSLEETLNEVKPQFRSEKPMTNKFSKEKDTAKNAIVIEFAENGDIFDYITAGPLLDKTTRFYFEQLLDAVEHLHKNGACHLDLKLENILLDKDFNIKLTDFGFSALIEKGQPLYKKTGTPSCRPPEMWRLGSEFIGYDGVKVDVFQLGLLLYIFVIGVPPFTEAHGRDPWYKPIAAGKWDIFWTFKEKAAKARKESMKVLDPEFKNLIAILLAADESLRPNIQEIRESEWFKKTPSATLEEVAEEMMARKPK